MFQRAASWIWFRCMNVISLPFASFGLTATGHRLDEKMLSRHSCSDAAMISEQLRMRPFMSMFSAIFLGNKRPDETIWLVSLLLRRYFSILPAMATKALQITAPDAHEGSTKPLLPSRVAINYKGKNFQRGGGSDHSSTCNKFCPDIENGSCVTQAARKRS